MKTYFASDFHLGTPDYESSLLREKKVVDWLIQIEKDAETLFLVGDIFDFWYEYKHAIPKNYSRLLGQLATMSDKGIKIYFFKGNHDMWTFEYLEKEIGMTIIDEEWEGEIKGKKFFVHHGDALGPGDLGYKFIRKVFRSNWAIWLFHRLHPNFGIGLAQYLSKRSRAKNSENDKLEIPLEKEYQYAFSKEAQSKEKRDFYIFGHRHHPRIEELDGGAKFVNLGDWVHYFTYAEFDGNEISLKTYSAS